MTLNVIFSGSKEGKPIVLLHGYPEFWYAWRGVIPVLVDAGFRVIVPDQRGYNESDKPPGAVLGKVSLFHGCVIYTRLP